MHDCLRSSKFALKLPFDFMELSGYISHGHKISKVKFAVEPSGPHSGAYPGFRSIKRLGALILLLDGMLTHRRLPQHFVRFS